MAGSDFLIKKERLEDDCHLVIKKESVEDDCEFSVSTVDSLQFDSNFVEKNDEIVKDECDFVTTEVESLQFNRDFVTKEERATDDSNLAVKEESVNDDCDFDYNTCNPVTNQTPKLLDENETDNDVKFVAWRIKTDEVQIPDVEFPIKAADSGEETEQAEKVDTLESKFCELAHSANFASQEATRKHVSSPSFKSEKLEPGTDQEHFSEEFDSEPHSDENAGLTAGHKCSVCDKKFEFDSHLKQHQATHKEDRPYACQVCSKRFPLKGDLKQHMAWHLRSKPHKCQLCEKRFVTRCHLNRHTLTHTGRKAFSCDICFKGFTRKEGLTVHVSSHTQIREHQCSV